MQDILLMWTRVSVKSLAIGEQVVLSSFLTSNTWRWHFYLKRTFLSDGKQHQTVLITKCWKDSWLEKKNESLAKLYVSIGVMNINNLWRHIA